MFENQKINFLEKKLDDLSKVVDKLIKLVDKVSKGLHEAIDDNQKALFKMALIQNQHKRVIEKLLEEK